MKKSLILTWMLLLILTLVSVSYSFINKKYTVAIILSLAIVKFICVAFQFMELRKAHLFWKLLLVVFVCVFSITFLGMSM